MTKKDIKKIVDQFKFERYGRIELPHGMHTKGLNRSATRDLVFPERIDGKSVLDIGTAYGYLCFEAEKLGATHVVGLETKPQRIKRAELFKEVLESNVMFLQESIIDYELPETYDYVIILNVLHHLKGHAQAVIEKLSEHTKEKLIIETPHLKHLQVPVETLLEDLGFEVNVIPSALEGPEAGSRQIYVCSK